MLATCALGPVAADCDGSLTIPHVLQVMQLQPRFAAVAQQLRLDHSTGDLPDDEDTAKGMARLFAEIGEAFTDIIAAGERQHLLECRMLASVTHNFGDDMLGWEFKGCRLLQAPRRAWRS